jgi:hypothetical protein
MSVYENLHEIIENDSPHWRVLQPIPDPSAFKYRTDANGENLAVLTTQNLETLATLTGRIFSSKSLDGPIAPWLNRDGKNLFEAPDIDSGKRLVKALNSGAKNFLGGPIFRNIVRFYTLALWTARQHDLIDPEYWGLNLAGVWTTQIYSFHMSVGISEVETEAMFRACGPTFHWNYITRSRDDLPEEIQLHRGIASDTKPEGFAGYSWSDDLDIAYNYARSRARQGRGSPRVITATFRKPDIAAVFEHGDERFDEYLTFPSSKPENVQHTQL